VIYAFYVKSGCLLSLKALLSLSDSAMNAVTMKHAKHIFEISVWLHRKHAAATHLIFTLRHT